MRPAPAPIPSLMPDTITATRRIIQVINTPKARLWDLCIDALIENYGDGSPVWLSGSNVWMPAVFDMDPDPDADFDVIFESADACERFVKGCMYTLKEFNVTKGTSGLGASRINHPDGTGIIDAWPLPAGVSITEFLMGYMFDYQRCAFYMSRSPSPGCLTRIVRPRDRSDWNEPARPSGILGSLLESPVTRTRSRSSY